MRTLIAALALVAAACTQGGTLPDGTTVATPGTAPPGPSGRVDAVLDGDSIRVVLDGVSTEVRLLGINAPERDECWADESRSALETLVVGTSLTLVGDDRDQFGRVLGYVYAGPDNLNLEMVGNGHALVIATEHDLLPEFLAAEEDAVALEKGMWGPGSCGSTTPEHEIRIWAFEPNPPGRDDMNPNGEFVALTNEGEDLDMTGWMLRDESSSHRYTFPDGFVLERGSIVTVRSGCGADSSSDLYWCADTTVWTNSGDTVLLLAPSGAVVERIRYLAG